MYMYHDHTPPHNPRLHPAPPPFAIAIAIAIAITARRSPSPHRYHYYPPSCAFNVLACTTTLLLGLLNIAISISRLSHEEVCVAAAPYDHSHRAPHTYIHIHIHTYTNIHTYTYDHSHPKHACAYIHVHTYTCIQTLLPCSSTRT